MNQLIVCREYPPFPYPPGGIATYVDHIAQLFAKRGETVHIVAQLWPGASRRHEVRLDGHLVVHRVPLDEPLPNADSSDAQVLKQLLHSAVPVRAFAWQAARLIETLVSSEPIDIIEAQEYEAPLYYLLQRWRSAPAPRAVPVVIHLHTPSEFLARANGLDLSAPEHLLLAHLEEYTIHAADALLCPSRFLATIAEQRYGLRAGTIQVLPYPIGDTPLLDRTIDTWSAGTICYVGRLEPRKGVYEWIDAAVSVACRDPSPRFVLIGGDPVHWGTGGSSVRDELIARIPPAVRNRFAFVDAMPRAQIAAHLRDARIAVVPSRWENFPNTCIEAMSTGLPVLVSPQGGMAEMIEDGRTGWTAAGADAGSLAAALQRALATGPSHLADMGAAAAASIRQLCDNSRTVQRHIELREKVVRTRSASDAMMHGRPPGVTAQLNVLDEKIRDLTAVAATIRPPQSAHTMTPLDVLTSSPRQQLAAVRRALGNPRYVARWLWWHAQRGLRAVSRTIVRRRR